MRFSDKPKWDVLIYGAGELGVMAKRTLDRDRGAKYNIVAFLDRDKKKTNKIIEGVKVFEVNQIKSLIARHNLSHLIIASPRLSVSQKNELIDICLAHKITVRDVPPLENWINGELSFNQIKHVKIEDLLGRDEINIDLKKIGQTLNNKTIFLSGAAGSIGSEICRQIMSFKPKELILFDQAESPLYELDLELKRNYPNQKISIIIGDVTNKTRLEKLFYAYKPEIVFHAAAYKHVPLMESNASEAIDVNVLGTKNIADLAHEYKSEKFILVSTDKAVNPTNVMGASKRIAEIYIQGLNTCSNTQYITTRFGNVLGSNGSVIPLFRKQIEAGGPLTVTHPDITRYFMTIPEACKLVLEAGAMGKGGEIFVFDMGESVKIIDLAKKMIQLSGLEVNKDINITFTGLRPGEKLYEELFNDREKMINTHHPDIFISEVFVPPLNISTKLIIELIKLNKSTEHKNLLPLLKELVPEYNSEQKTISI